MVEIKTVAVFCGAQAGDDPAYRQAAEALGRGLAEAGMSLVFGGGRIGLMGAIADAALAAGGRVIGVIPKFLTEWEVAHEGVADMTVTDSMHTRKRRMFDIADAFVTLPGGLGTMDETIEIITWRQLKLHDKPILFCDVKGSAGALVAAIEDAIAHGFAKPEVRRLYEVVDGVPATLRRLACVTGAPGGESARL
jgi:uncharacterized protein (TIGR00730 family)